MNSTATAMTDAAPKTDAIRAARIVLIDDHPIVRKGLVATLAAEDDLDIVGEASSVSEGYQKLRDLRPDLAVVDLSLGDGHGLELIKQVHAHDWGIKILVCSMLDEALYTDRVVRAGASGYLRKDQAADHVVEAVRAILSGSLYLSESATSRVLAQISSGQSVRGETAIDQLSDRELEVFEMIGDGLGSREIAGRLHLSIKTVETYREKIKAKLELKNGNELTRHAIHYRMREQDGV
ncbi:MAG: response regulator transcription factor [Planctomycetota bacterium]